MVDENQQGQDEQNEAPDEASWEQNFREMAESQEPQPRDELRESLNGLAPDAQPSTESPMALAEKAEAGNGGPKAGQPAGVDIDFLLDISLDVTVEVGRTKMLVNDLLQLQQGSVIDLDKMVGEPFEVYVNKKLMAYGEIVVVNEKFGVRLTDVIDPKERIQQLG